MYRSRLAMRLNKTSAAFLMIAGSLISTTAMAQRKVQIQVNDGNGPACNDTIARVLIIEKKEGARNVVTERREEKNCRFETGLPKGDYTITLFGEGYETLTRSFVVTDTQPDTLNLTLNRLNKTLDEVVVRPRMKRFMSWSDDKMLVQVSNNPLLNTGDVFDALEKTPGIIITPDGNISLKGKPNVTIWIDGRPTGLSGDNLAALLRSFPANSVEKFELISNPGAGYDANAAGGIINIITYKGKVKGTTLSFNSDLSKGINSKTLNSVRVANRGKFTNTLLMAGYSTQGSTTQTSTDFLFNDPAYNRLYKSDENSMARQPFVNLNADAGLTPKINAGLKASVSFDSRTDNSSYQTKFNNPANTFWQSDNRRRTDFNLASFGLFATWQLKKNTDAKWSVNADFIHSNRDAFNDILERNNIYGETRNLYSISNNLTDNKNRILESRITWPVKKLGLRVAGGLKFSGQDVSSTGKYNLQRTQQISGKNFSTETGYTFKEQVNAGFAEFSRKFKALSLYAGLRYEHTHTRSLNASGATYYDTSYGGFFPSFQVNYDLSVIYLNASYSRKLSRPGYGNMDPNLVYQDSLFQRSGNPFLAPNFSNNYEAGIYVQGYPMITYSISDDRNATFFTMSAENGIIKNSFSNIAHTRVRNLYCMLPIPISLITRPRQFMADLKANRMREDNTNYIALYMNHNRYEFLSGGLEGMQVKPLISTGAIFKYDVKKLFSINGFYNYYLGGNSYFYNVKGFKALDLTLSAFFMDKKLQVKLYGRDIFNGRRTLSTGQFNNLQVLTDLKYETRRFGISMSYNIGKFALQFKEKNGINVNETKGQQNFKSGL